MYNILLVGIIIILITKVMKINQATNYVVQAIGILWATIFCSCVFVLPRLLRVKERKRASMNEIGGNGCISGRRSSAFRLNSSVRENDKIKNDSQNNSSGAENKT